jgi:hypothetical protein
MRTLNKLVLSFLLTVLAAGGLSAQTAAGQKIEERIVTFRFMAGKDMFYIPYSGNDAELNRLYALVDEYRAEITSGKLPVRVDGYCASLPMTEENFKIAVVRSNRVKSELITHKGLSEEHFTTKNHASAYVAPDGRSYRDMVVVTLRIPAKVEVVAVTPEPVKEEPKREEPQPERKPEPEPVVEKQPEPQVVAPVPTAQTKPYCLAVRTNLLYDAFLTPTLGIEWRASRNIGIKLDGSLAWWGDSKGKVQKMWLVSPEVRWYLLDNKRFYVGVGGNYGEYNIYKGMVGDLFSDDTGYQGKLWNAEAVVGYQLKLSRAFSLDFNLGLGYTHFEYDNFNVINEVRVYKDRDKTKNFWGPTQAGISLIWTLGK